MNRGGGEWEKAEAKIIGSRGSKEDPKQLGTRIDTETLCGKAL